MKALNKVIVEIGDPYEQEMQYGDLSLKIDPQFNPTAYSKTVGKIVSCPDKYDDISDGDIIFFHYGAIDINPGDKEIASGQYMIDYRDIFARKTGEKIESVGNWVICIPITVPVPHGYKLENDHGKNILVSENTGLIADTDFEHELRSIYTVVSDSKRPEMNGKIVYTKRDCDFDNYGRKIMGVKYYYVERDLIVAHGV